MIFFACYFCVVLDRLQDGPRGSQEAPRPPQERPKRLQEAPKSAPGGSKRASRDPKIRPRASQDAHKAFPKHLVRQPFSEKLKAYAHKVFPKHLVRQLFSEKWKNSKHGSQKASKTHTIPEVNVSMNPKGLAPTRKMKKGGRAAVMPLGASQSAARTEGEG